MGDGKKTLRGKRSKQVTSINELADYFHVHRNTMSKRLKERDVDLKDLYSVLQFVRDYEKRV